MTTTTNTQNKTATEVKSDLNNAIKSRKSKLANLVNFSDEFDGLNAVNLTKHNATTDHTDKDGTTTQKQVVNDALTAITDSPIISASEDGLNAFFKSDLSKQLHEALTTAQAGAKTFKALVAKNVTSEAGKKKLIKYANESFIFTRNYYAAKSQFEDFESMLDAEKNGSRKNSLKGIRCGQDTYPAYYSTLRAYLNQLGFKLGFDKKSNTFTIELVAESKAKKAGDKVTVILGMIGKLTEAELKALQLGFANSDNENVIELAKGLKTATISQDQIAGEIDAENTKIATCEKDIKALKAEITKAQKNAPEKVADLRSKLNILTDKKATHKARVLTLTQPVIKASDYQDKEVVNH